MSEAEKDKATIEVALVAARGGGASVSQLARAHEIAEKHQLPSTTAEIRRHLRNLIPNPDNGSFAIGRALVVGVGAGVLTHFLLRLTQLRRSGAT